MTYSCLISYTNGREKEYTFPEDMPYANLVRFCEIISKTHQVYCVDFWRHEETCWTLLGVAKHGSFE